MQKHITWTKLGPKTRGLHTPLRIYSSNKNGKLSSPAPLIGEVHLYGDFGIEALIHELQHVCINFLRIKKLDPFDTKVVGRFLANDSGEEMACYSIGFMARQAVTTFNKNNIWP